MKTTPLLTTPLVLACCFSSIFPAHAQEPAKTQRIASIEMKSGTLGELVDLLRRDTTQSILLPDEFRNLALPEVFLRNVDAISALEAVDQLVPEMLVNMIRDRENKNEIIYITSGLPPAPPTRKICRVFKMSNRAPLKPDELNQFIENVTSVSLLACNVNAESQGRPNTQPPVIKAHTSTGLLIVAGDEEDVQLTGQIIAGLGGEALPLGNAAGAPSGLRIEADTMTFDSKGNTLKLLQSGGPWPSVVEVPGTAPEKTGKDTQAYLERLKEAAKKLEMSGTAPEKTWKDAQAYLERMHEDAKKSNRKAEDNFRNQTETDPLSPPTGK